MLQANEIIEWNMTNEEIIQYRKEKKVCCCSKRCCERDPTDI